MFILTFKCVVIYVYVKIRKLPLVYMNILIHYYICMPLLGNTFHAVNNYRCKFKHKNISVQIYQAVFIEKDMKI